MGTRAGNRPPHKPGGAKHLGRVKDQLKPRQGSSEARHGPPLHGRPADDRRGRAHSRRGAAIGRPSARFQSGLDVPLLGIHDCNWATIVNIASRGADYEANLPGQGQHANDSPTLYATDRDTYLVQGYTVTDPDALAQMRIPDGETVVEVPKRLMRYLPPEEQQHEEGHR